MRTRMSWRDAVAAQAPMLLLMSALLTWMGRAPLCDCGVALWVGDIWSAENSQQVADAYSFIHVLHGVLFFGLMWLAWRSASVPARLVAVTAFAVGWELVENSQFVIALYRAHTISSAYAGDTILNSTADVCFCMAGFLLAWKAPWRLSATFAVLTEVALAVWIRDGLLLNILMLLYPVEAIRAWQLGG